MGNFFYCEKQLDNGKSAKVHEIQGILKAKNKTANSDLCAPGSMTSQEIQAGIS